MNRYDVIYTPVNKCESKSALAAAQAVLLVKGSHGACIQMGSNLP